MANIKDVAKRAGVGLGTVSRYINGYNVTESNKKKIEQAINELHFTVNPIARSMKTKKSMMVAIVVPRLANIFSMRIIESIEHFLEAYGYSVIVCDCGGSAEKEMERLKFCVKKMVDGIVLMPSGRDSSKIKSIIKDTPMVLIDRVFESNDFDSVTVENKYATFMAMSQYIQNGNKNIAVLAGSQHISTAKERLEGVIEAFKEHGMKLENDKVYECEYDMDQGYYATKKILKNKPDLIFASNYELTLGAIKAINEEKLIIGRDISLIGFDNLELINIYPYSMTVISQPVEEIGKRAAECLYERMNNNGNGSIKNIILKNEILQT